MFAKLLFFLFSATFLCLNIADQTIGSGTNIEKYEIELLVALDPTIYAQHGAKTHNYTRCVLSSASQILSHPSIGTRKPTIKLIDMVQYPSSNDTFVLLESFCSWQNNYRMRNPSVHFDAALLLTRKSTCTGGAHNCALGWAYVKTICQYSQFACAVAYDGGTATPWTVAHELGHLLGMSHDDEALCNSFYKENNAHNDWIYRKHTGFRGHMWFPWTNCARHHVDQHLSTKGGCLLDRSNQTTNQLKWYDQYYFGQYYSLDEQCRVAHGKQSTYCGSEKSERSCNFLWCRNGQNVCIHSELPWADGTACGMGRWCEQTVCKAVNTTAKIMLGKGNDGSNSFGITRPRIFIPRIFVPKISIPRISIPGMSIPEISIPEISIPEISIPDISIPDISFLED